MKSLAGIITTAILFSALSLAYLGSANAADKEFVASQCGKVELSSKVQEICFGGNRIKGNELVQYKFENGQTEIFDVVDRQSLLSALDGGRIKANVFLKADSGTERSLRVIFFRNGVAQSASGEVEHEAVVVREFLVK